MGLGRVGYEPEGNAKRRRLGFFAVAFGTLLALVVASLGAFGASAQGNEKVTLCHATDSNTNPYNVITVDENSIQNEITGPNGHGSHTGPVWNPTLKDQHIQWGDIIPAFNIGGISFPGLNVPEGQGFLDSNCEIPGPPVTPTTPTTSVTPTTAAAPPTTAAAPRAAAAPPTTAAAPPTTAAAARPAAPPSAAVQVPRAPAPAAAVPAQARGVTG